MSEHDAFLRAICANPDDDTARLVFADWLQEHGEPDRAEFIRLHIEWCRHAPDVPPDDLWLQLGVAWEASKLSQSPMFGDGYDAHDRGLVAGVWFNSRFRPERVEAAFDHNPIRIIHVSPRTEESAVWLAQTPLFARLRGLCHTGRSVDVARRLVESPHIGNLELLRLDLEDDEGRTEDVGSILASARHLDRLTVLDLDGTHINDAGFEALVAAPHLGTVRKLIMRSDGRTKHYIGEAGLRALADSRGLTGLTHLGLRDCTVHAEGVTQLLRWPGVGNLHELDLVYAGIEEAGVIELARCPYLKSLRRLCLCAFDLTDRALEALAAAPWMSHLRQLRIEAREYYGDMEEEATDEGLAAFKVRLGPRLHMPAKNEDSFELSFISETERIWHRLRRCQIRDETGLNLACIL
ncbi:Repeat-companion domain protein OS=Isosphaera pallida (strain ATCC 43644 / DSM 9630 / IS1B) GN=Isop_0391 PE=4 SV=1: LRR_6 [Gemmata massiliana]|uniref:Repeat-companion domain protein n=1 Tax=Gemmata massiliana TaxID=1210884 RepID=A0A6P2DN08_9BACT|nr:TIGR02996 domain-containing protein [Gemmata massiliana]VTS02303.1 Repeat-companion domain protein OS=Isosphaera pallida (strain ATCC 43644 / DSM 9630 / IS1B) GN=Isop_0391 PE=4 SV=1: LRR_6 [Gemmata massiliana]